MTEPGESQNSALSGVIFSTRMLGSQAPSVSRAMLLFAMFRSVGFTALASGSLPRTRSRVVSVRAKKTSDEGPDRSCPNSHNGASTAMFHRSLQPVSRRRVAHGLDIVAVAIEHEGAVVTGVIMRADAGRAVVATARRESFLVESVDRGAVLGQDRDMQRLVQAAFPADPEIRLAIGAKSGRRIMSGLLLRHFHDEAVAERGPRLCIEGLGAKIVGNRKTDVVDHENLLRLR